MELIRTLFLPLFLQSSARCWVFSGFVFFRHWELWVLRLSFLSEVLMFYVSLTRTICFVFKHLTPFSLLLISDFFERLELETKPLSLHSSIRELVHYVQQGLARLKDTWHWLTDWSFTNAQLSTGVFTCVIHSPTPWLISLPSPRTAI